MNTTSKTPKTDVPANPVTVDAAPPPAPAPQPPAPILVPLPPATANIPDPPPGFVPVKGGFGRGVKPRKAEMAVMPDATSELRAFVDYAGTLGKFVPSQAEAIQTFDASTQWSIMRVRSRAWDKYAGNEEGVAWVATRSAMVRMKPAWDLAAQTDPGLATRYPKLATLFGAKKTIAQKGVVSRTANKKAVAAGQPATHGVAAQKLARAQKAVAAAGAKAPPHATPAPVPVPVPAGNGEHAAPAVAPVVAAAVAPATTNGASHS
jgi:hypothetical protein